MGPVEGMEPIDIKNYIRYIADWRQNNLISQYFLMLKHHYHGSQILNGVERNFFEARATSIQSCNFRSGMVKMVYGLYSQKNKKF